MRWVVDLPDTWSLEACLRLSVQSRGDTRTIEQGVNQAAFGLTTATTDASGFKYFCAAALI